MTITQLGATVAAIVASMLTMFGIIVVRGTKITEFRQKWIDEQRNDISTLISNAIQLSEYPNTNRNDRFIAMDGAANRIKLRENPTKPEWSNVINEIDLLRTKLSTPPQQQINIQAEIKNIVTLSALNLKKEWSRVRSGEIGYRIFYRLIMSVFAISLLVFVGILILRYNGYQIIISLPN